MIFPYCTRYPWGAKTKDFAAAGEEDNTDDLCPIKAHLVPVYPRSQITSFEIDVCSFPSYKFSRIDTVVYCSIRAYTNETIHVEVETYDASYRFLRDVYLEKGDTLDLGDLPY